MDIHCMPIQAVCPYSLYVRTLYVYTGAGWVFVSSLPSVANPSPSSSGKILGVLENYGANFPLPKSVRTQFFWTKISTDPKFSARINLPGPNFAPVGLRLAGSHRPQPYLILSKPTTYYGSSLLYPNKYPPVAHILAQWLLVTPFLSLQGQTV